MGVYIKGMEMPKNCMLCPLCVEEADQTNGEMCMVTGKLMPHCNHERLMDCPLIEIKPHGRLIDADEISEHKYTTIPPHRKKYADGKPKSDEETIAFKFGWNYAIDAIVENAPTVIDAGDKDINVLGKEEGE